MRWRPSKIFISYRRDDSAVHAHSLNAELVTAFGAQQVFFDVKAIQYGDPFPPEIERYLKACDVMVAVIGPQWQTLAGEDGRPRILSPHDYVRHEVATALRSGKRVIPVLVEGARMPDRASLPTDIAALADINALTFSDRQIGEDAERLIKAIHGPDETPIELFRRTLSRRVGLAAALCMLVAAWLSLFDFFSLDTKAASFTLWVADTVAPVQPSADLQIIVIDPDTERVLGKAFRRNPGARRDHADLIRALALAGAKTVAFDVFITTPSATDDAELVSAIEAARALKTAVVFGAKGFDNEEQPVMVPALRAAVSVWAVLCVGEQLGYATTVPLASQSPAKGSELPKARAIGLALAAANPRSGHVEIDEDARKVIVWDNTSRMKKFPYSEIDLISEHHACQTGLQGDAVASALYRMPPRALLNSPEHRLKYETVRTLGVDALRQRFQGKTVLVGLEMPGEDVFATFHGWSSEERHGLELHAGATSALLSGSIVQPLGWWGAFIMMMALGLLGSRLSQWKPAGQSWPGFAMLLVSLAVCIATAVALCLNLALLVNLMYPAGALGFGFWGAGKLAPKT
jgi:CHASE2 domain-containing sensor protein